MEYSGFENDASVLLLVPIYYGCLAQMEFSDAEKKKCLQSNAEVTCLLLTAQQSV